MSGRLDGRTRWVEGESTSTSTRQGRGTNRGGGAVLLHADLAGIGLDGGEARRLGADAGGDANLRGDGAREGGQSAVVARVITWRLDGRRVGRNDHRVAFADAAARGRTWFTRVPREKAADLPAFTATGVVREAMADIVADVTREVECARGGMLRTRQPRIGHSEGASGPQHQHATQHRRTVRARDGRNRTTDQSAQPRFRKRIFSSTVRSKSEQETISLQKCTQFASCDILRVW